MASNKRKAKDFQLDFLDFLSTKPNEDVFIYHHIINYWSNDDSIVSLGFLKDAITDLCNRGLVLSVNNAHQSIGKHGIPVEVQKNIALCRLTIQGVAYVNREKTRMKLVNYVTITCILGIIVLIWHFRHFITYFFR
jgi:hypothetical protein